MFWYVLFILFRAILYDDDDMLPWYLMLISLIIFLPYYWSCLFDYCFTRLWRAMILLTLPDIIITLLLLFATDVIMPLLYIIAWYAASLFSLFRSITIHHYYSDFAFIVHFITFDIPLINYFPSIHIRYSLMLSLFVSMMLPACFCWYVHIMLLPRPRCRRLLIPLISYAHDDPLWLFVFRWCLWCWCCLIHYDIIFHLDILLILMPAICRWRHAHAVLCGDDRYDPCSTMLLLSDYLMFVDVSTPDVLMMMLLFTICRHA